MSDDKDYLFNIINGLKYKFESIYIDALEKIDGNLSIVEIGDMTSLENLEKFYLLLLELNKLYFLNFKYGLVRYRFIHISNLLDLSIKRSFMILLVNIIVGTVPLIILLNIISFFLFNSTITIDDRIITNLMIKNKIIEIIIIYNSTIFLHEFGHFLLINFFHEFRLIGIVRKHFSIGLHYFNFSNNKRSIKKEIFII